MKLSQKYNIAGETTDELDLTPIQTAKFSLMLTAEQMATANGEILALIESDLSFLHTFAGLALEIPAEDLLALDIYDDTVFLSTVNALLNAQATVDGYTVKLSEPFVWENNATTETITEIDLSGINDLTGLDVCRAQRAAANGRQCVAPQADSYCLMLLASKATGKPLRFFNELPAGVGNAIRTLMKVRFFTRRGSQITTPQEKSGE